MGCPVADGLKKLSTLTRLYIMTVLVQSCSVSLSLSPPISGGIFLFVTTSIFLFNLCVTATHSPTGMLFYPHLGLLEKLWAIVLVLVRDIGH